MRCYSFESLGIHYNADMYARERFFVGRKTKIESKYLGRTLTYHGVLEKRLRFAEGRCAVVCTVVRDEREREISIDIIFYPIM